MTAGGWLLALVALAGLTGAVLYSMGAVVAGGVGLSGALLLWAYWQFGRVIWAEWTDARRPAPSADEPDRDA